MQAPAPAAGPLQPCPVPLLSEHTSRPGAPLRLSRPFLRGGQRGRRYRSQGRQRRAGLELGSPAEAAGQERPRRPARCMLGAALIYAGPRSAPGAAGGGGGERGRERRGRGGDRGSPGGQRFCRPLRPWRHRRAAGTTDPASADPAPATTDVEAVAAGGAGPGPRGPSRRGGAPAAR